MAIIWYLNIENTSVKNTGIIEVKIKIFHNNINIWTIEYIINTKSCIISPLDLII